MNAAPEWYADAIARSPEHSIVDVDGAAIAIRIWGPRDGAPVVLVHGGAAHAGWWDHIGPMIEGCRVIAMDLSGHGDSSWRDAYRIGTWRDEVLAVIRSEHFARRPVLVGHSMGGLVTYATAHSHGAELAGAIIVDSYFPHREEGDSWRTFRQTQRRVHADPSDLLARFRLMPATEPRFPFAIDHVARHSMAEVAGGWSWKFDPKVFAHDGVTLEDILPVTECPTMVVRGDGGLLTENDARAIAYRLGGADMVTIRDSGHHVPLDQPIALANLIANTARSWSTGSFTSSQFDDTIGES